MKEENTDIWFLFVNGYSFKEAREAVSNAYKLIENEKGKNKND